MLSIGNWAFTLGLLTAGLPEVRQHDEKIKGMLKALKLKSIERP